MLAPGAARHFVHQLGDRAEPRAGVGADRVRALPAAVGRRACRGVGVRVHAAEALLPRPAVGLVTEPPLALAADGHIAVSGAGASRGAGEAGVCWPAGGAASAGDAR